MMRTIGITVARGLCMLALGVLLLTFSEQMPEWIVMAVGALFVVPGAVTLVGCFVRDKSAKPAPLTPIVGVGSILLGVLMLALPSEFVNFMMYVLGAVLVVFGAMQIYNYASINRRGVRIPWWCYIIPLAALCGGLYVFFRPREAAGLPFVIIGISGLISGLADLYAALRMRKLPRLADTAADVKAITSNTEGAKE